MSVFRIYPTKANTIASGAYKYFNSSQNAVTDLFYGGGVSSSVFLRNAYSRFIVHFDLNELQNKISNKEIMSGNVVSYRLRMRNSIPAERILEKNFEYDKLQRMIAASYDLICFPVNKEWDEGRGYDLIEEDYLVRQKGNLQATGYSNWMSSTRATDWDEPGVYTNPTASTSLYTSQHFAIGNEHMNMDITSIVNDWLTGGSQNNGLCVAFRRDYELMSSETRYIASFFTHKTNSAWKPYIEVTYNQTIKDDRNQVTNNRKSKLFLYTYSSNTNVNYFSASTVDILNSSNVVVYSGLTPTQLEKGVYYVEVFMSSATKGQQYKDVWKGVTFSPGYDVQDITQTFTVQDNFYTGRMFSPSLNEYALDVYGIPEGGILYNNQNVRVFCDMRVNYTTESPKNNYSIKYRMIMNNQDEVIPWTEVNQIIYDKCKTNYFNLDTSWLLHNQTYEIQFMIAEMGANLVHPKKINFRVLRPF